MIKIRVIFPSPQVPKERFRKLADLLPYQDEGVELSLSENAMGPSHGQCDIETSLARAGMAQAAIQAASEDVDAIVIDAMGDPGLLECREAVRIPVVGMSDSSLRVAQMLGRQFGIITAGQWHGYALERLMKSYGIFSQYVGFRALNLQPFLTDVDAADYLNRAVMAEIDALLDLGADTIVLGGSYFIGRDRALAELLKDEKYKDLLIIDPLPLAIRFARMLVDSKLSQSKRIYATPTHATPVVGYPTIFTTPGALVPTSKKPSI